MPETPSKGDKKAWGVSSAPNPEKDLPPWDRANPAYGIGAGKDEKSTKSVTVRLTTKEYRDLQKIVQHRKFPVVENYSDGIRIGLTMFRYWYALRHGTPEMVEKLDVEMWENERLAKSRFRDRVLTILDQLGVEMAEARRLGYEKRLEVSRAELKKYKSQLVDEELLGKANRLYVEFSGS